MPKLKDIDKVLIIGSGPIVIGQACEFDYSGTQACKALRKLGYKIVLVNSNPATIMTDPETADVISAVSQVLISAQNYTRQGCLTNIMSRLSVYRWMPSNAVRTALSSKRQ